MDKIFPFPSKQVTAKLSEADYNTVVEIYNRYYPETPDVSFKEFFSRLLKDINTDNEELLQGYFTQLEGLQEALNKSEAEKNQLAEYLDETSQRENELQARLKDAIQAVETKSVIPADHILVHIKPDMNFFLQKCSEQATRVMKREVTRAQILEHLFFEQIYEGPGDHLPLRFSKSEIKRVMQQYAEKLKQQEGGSNE